MVEGYIIPDFAVSPMTTPMPWSMKKLWSDGCARMDLDACETAHDLRYPACAKFESSFPEFDEIGDAPRWRAGRGSITGLRGHCERAGHGLRPIEHLHELS